MSVIREFPQSPSSVRAARRFVTEQLSGVAPDVVSAAVAAVSELATNSVLHAASEYSVRVTLDAAQVRVEVTDQGPGTPTQRSPAASDRSGRGLNILESITDDWGITVGTGSKTVWYTIALESSDGLMPASDQVAGSTESANNAPPSGAPVSASSGAATAATDSVASEPPPTARGASACVRSKPSVQLPFDSSSVIRRRSDGASHRAFRFVARSSCSSPLA